MRPGFYRFLEKSAGVSVQEKLDLHFDTLGNGKKWTTFRKNLRSKAFAEAAKTDPRADEKLKKYVEMVHLHQTGKGPTFKVKSETSGKSYTVRYHPSIERYSCSCPDWTIKHSVNGKDCKHIKKLKAQASMVKKAAAALRGIGSVANLFRLKENNEEQAWHAGQVNRIHKAVNLRGAR